MTPRFLRIGHRGAAAYATENTLSSIETAIACQVDMVELDVRLSKDRQLVLAHNPIIKAFNKRMKVSKHTLAELKQLCLPGGESVATLDEALRFIKGKAMVNIDLKVRGCEEEVVALIKKLHMEHQVMVSSFHANSLTKVKRLNPSLYVTLSYPSSVLIHLYQWRPIQPLVKVLERKFLIWSGQVMLRRLMPWKVKRMTLEQGIDALIIRAPLISPKLVDIVHNKELELYAFNADAPHEVAQLQEIGVDGIESNRPDVLQTPDSHTLAHS